MKSVTVKFNNPDFNYQTSINPACTTEEIRKYFVGTMFNVSFSLGYFDIKCENKQRCIDVEVSEADND